MRKVFFEVVTLHLSVRVLKMSKEEGNYLRFKGKLSRFSCPNGQSKKLAVRRRQWSRHFIRSIKNSNIRLQGVNFYGIVSLLRVANKLGE